MSRFFMHTRELADILWPRRAAHHHALILDSIWQQRITLQEYYQEPLADAAAYDATELYEDAFRKR